MHSSRYKQDQRSSRIANLPAAYHAPLSPDDIDHLTSPIQSLVHNVQIGASSPTDILRAYGKTAVQAQASTNCVTEVLIPEAEEQIKNGNINLKGPLAGIPVSLKDSVHVAGCDACIGYSCHSRKPQPADGILTQILKRAGAVPFVKTNVPITLLSFESSNDVWGRTTNPHNARYSPGGSSGGEAALLALGGSRIGVGSDVAGSVRAPAHFSGCYSLRCSVGRWPKSGITTSTPGQEGVQSVFSPMTRTLNDLVYFTKSLIQTEPWTLDHSVHPLAWREDAAETVRSKQRLRIGVLKDDGVVTPSPACARALQETITALEKEGHDVFDVLDCPSPYKGLQIASLLVNSDGGATFRSFFRSGEWMDKGAAQLSFYMRLPRPLKYLWYLYVRHIRRDPIWAGLLGDWHPKTMFEQWKLVVKRETYKAKWHEWWNSTAKTYQTDDDVLQDEKEKKETAPFDFLITPPNATPAVPHDGMHDAVSSCGYTFLFNLLDYAAGILPVAHVSKLQDALPPTFRLNKLNGVAQGAYKHYSASEMDGLPVGVQIVCRRLEEERVLACMERVENALEKRNGGRYQLLEPWKGASSS